MSLSTSAKCYLSNVYCPPVCSENFSASDQHPSKQRTSIYCNTSLTDCICWLLARSDSPATRKRGLVSVDYSQGSRAKEASSGSSFLISMNDFTLLRVIGRGSYAKVLLVSDAHSQLITFSFVTYFQTFPYHVSSENFTSCQPFSLNPIPGFHLVLT